MKPIKFLDQPTPCRKCGLPCITVKIGGRMPMHPSCDPRYWTGYGEPQTDAEFVETVHMIAEVLGPLVLDAPPPPARPHDLGPCRRCRARTRAYGPWSHPLCPDCQKGTTRP